MTDTTARTLIYLPQSGIVHYAAPGFDPGVARSPFTETNPICGARLMGGVVTVDEVGPYALCRLCQAADTARTALRETSTDGLLTTFAALTHHIDAAHRDRSEARGAAEYARLHNITADLRAQRDLIRAEVLRRTGDL